MDPSELYVKDRAYVWHPYAQEKIDRPIVIESAKGSLIFDENGKSYIDAISSWWVTLHGHADERIQKAISEQSAKMEQVIFSGFTHKPAIELAEGLLKHLPKNQKRVFYSDNGSTAVEVALKLSNQYTHKNYPHRKKVIAFQNAYHGDTIGMMSIGERGKFTEPFANLLFDCEFVPAPIPGHEQEAIQQLQQLLDRDNISTFVFEPLVQGTAGMVLHSAQVLSDMIALCQKHRVLTIADEVFTGFGRTGTWFASDQLETAPDIICMSKGITGGFLPLGATSCSEEIYQNFYSDSRLDAFFHGHSYTANPIACAAASKSLEILEDRASWEKIENIKHILINYTDELHKIPTVKEVRQLGTILAIEIQTNSESSYFNPIRDQLYQHFLEQGILLRPLGNILYLVPPYCISKKELDYVIQAIMQALNSKML